MPKTYIIACAGQSNMLGGDYSQDSYQWNDVIAGTQNAMVLDPVNIFAYNSTTREVEELIPRSLDDEDAFPPPPNPEAETSATEDIPPGWTPIQRTDKMKVQYFLRGETTWGSFFPKGPSPAFYFALELLNGLPVGDRADTRVILVQCAVGGIGFTKTAQDREDEKLAEIDSSKQDAVDISWTKDGHVFSLQQTLLTNTSAAILAAKRRDSTLTNDDIETVLLWCGGEANAKYPEKFFSEKLKNLLNRFKGIPGFKGDSGRAASNVKAVLMPIASAIPDVNKALEKLANGDDESEGKKWVAYKSNTEWVGKSANLTPASGSYSHPHLSHDNTHYTNSGMRLLAHDAYEAYKGLS